MSISNIIDPTTRKIYQELIPPNPLAVPNLNQVLIAGNSAGTIGNPQTIENLDELETQKIYQGNYLQLELGESGDTVLLKGATPLGTLHVGNGLSIEKLPVGADGLVLKANSSSITGLGLEWAVDAGSGLTGIGAGTNISVNNTVPLVPVVSLSNPLTSNVSLGTTSIDGTTGSLAFVNGNVPVQSEASIQAGGVSTYSTVSGSQIATMTKTGFTTQDTSANLLTIAPTSIIKTGATDMSISSVSSAITITPSGASNVNVIVSGNGALKTSQTSTGGPSQPATIVENTNGGANAVHLDLYKNSNSPATNDGIGALSFHANNASGTKVEYGRISCDQRDTTAGSENGSISILTNVNSPTPSEFFRFNGATNFNELYKFLETRGNYIQNTTAGGGLTLLNTANAGNIVLNNIGAFGNINNNCSNGQYSVSSNSFSIGATTTGGLTTQGNLTLSTNANVIIPQYSSTNTKLTTEIANVNYYPTFLVDNNNSNNVSIPPPSIQGQRLTIVNKGITPASTWINYGSAVSGAGVYAVQYASTGQIWISRKDSNVIEVWDNSISSVVGNITLAGWSARAYCFYEESGYMYIGGSFYSVNGNAIGQYCITRVNVYSFSEDPLYDSGTSYSGVDGSTGNDGVYAISSFSGNLYCGGQFNSIVGGGPPIACANLIAISSYGSTSGAQTFYDPNGGTNAKINTLLNANGYLWIGGDFTIVQVIGGGIGYQYIAVWNGGAWDYVGGNAFNGSVNVIQNYCGYPYLIVAGAFTSPYPYVCHVDYVSPNNYPTDTTLSISQPINRNCISYTGVVYLLTSSQGVYYSQTFQVWSNIGSPYSGVPSFMGYFNGEPKVAFEDYTFIQSKTNVSQASSFTLTSGNFKFNTTLYTTATLGIPDIGWDFVGDLTSGAVWRQTSYNPWGSYT